MTETSREDVVDAIRAERVIGIIRQDSVDAAVGHGRKLFAAGLRVIEVSFTTPGAAKAIAILRAQASPGTYVGAGTVLTRDVVDEAIAAGAQLIVAPNLEPEVVRHASDRGVAVLPGVATASETTQAVNLGADLVKLFPASTIGPSGMAAILEALPDVLYVPTGGVSLEDSPRWLDAGAAALGMGGSLATGTVEEITARVTAFRKQPTS